MQVKKKYERKFPKKIKPKYDQKGDSAYFVDIAKKAKLPGWRKSKSGKIYYENRKNRSDEKGTRY